jgi:phospholipid/cholesterol/gamma-HCH transport system substrate-binding protein
MESRVNYALVGAFVLALSAAAIAVLLWLAAGGPRHSYTRYLLLMNESVWALPPDAAVRLNGVKVGHVTDISLDPNNPQEVRIVLDIIDGTPIKTDTRATLQMQGITGLAFISLTGGSENAPPLTRKAGEPYPVIPNTPSLMQRLDVILTEVGGSLTTVSKRLGILLNDRNMEHLSSTISNLDTLSGRLAANSGRLGNTLTQFDATLRDIRSSTSKLPGLIDNMNRSVSKLPTLIDKLDHSTQRFNSAADKVGAAAIAVQQALPQVDSALQQLGDTADTYRRLGEQLQHDPSALLYGPTPAKPGPGE